MTYREIHSLLSKQSYCVICDKLFVRSKHFKVTCSIPCRRARRLINQTRYENGDTIAFHGEDDA